MEIEWNHSFYQYKSESDFDSEDQKLIKAAKEATKLSYAPYSNFNVGAAVILEDGNILLGANQENAAYPEGSCAERVVIFKAATIGGVKKIIRKIAVVAIKDGKLMSASPCGGCRQVLLEAEAIQKKPIELIMMAEDQQWIKTKNVKSLLPFSFKL